MFCYVTLRHLLRHLRLFALEILYHALSKELIDQLHGEGIKINCWTVDKREDAERLAGWGVNFITTNILE